MTTEEVLAGKEIMQMVKVQSQERDVFVRNISNKLRIDEAIVQTVLQDLISEDIIKTEEVNGKEIISPVKKIVHNQLRH